MDTVDEVALHLAERLAPDEADLAPLYARAAIDGKLRDIDRSDHTTVLGGFGPELFQAIDGALLCQVLGALSAVVTIVDFGLNARRSAATARSVDRLAQALELRGLSPERARTTSNATLAALEEMPDKAQVFLLALREGQP